MKRTYEKPAARKVEIEEDILRMFSHQGFKDLFWETLKEARKADDSVTQQAVFDALNNKWVSVFGSPRYSDYNSFRARLNK